MAQNGVDLTALPVGEGCTLPTFHSMSLYYHLDPTSAPSQVFVRYRKATGDPTVWKEGHPLWCDNRTDTTSEPLYFATCRGSVVYLLPNTDYVFQLALGSSYGNADWVHAKEIDGKTWDARPDKWTNPDQSPESTISANANANVPWSPEFAGSASNGYQVYNGNNNTYDVGGRADYCMYVDKSWVVIKNIICKGGNRSGIQIANGVTNVVIDNVEVTGFAQAEHHNTLADAAGWDAHGESEAAGIRLGVGGGQTLSNNSKIVIQRSRIHTPQLGAFPWDIDHPVGPNAIFVNQGGRQNVFRYNEIYSLGTDHQWFGDGIGGGENFSTKGAPGADSDIYQNIISNVYDDGIEAEGGGRNVRIWGNYIDHSAVGIATTVAQFGPIYIFRNVINRLRFYHMRTYPGYSAPSPDADDHDANRGKAFKAHSQVIEDGATWGGGRHYFFNNTLLQQPGASYDPQNPQQWDLGAGDGIAGGGPCTSCNPPTPPEPVVQTWSRNNILQIWRSGANSIHAYAGTNNDFRKDLYNGAADEPDVDGVNQTPTYKSGHGWSAFPRLTVLPSGPTDPHYGTGLAVGLGQFQLQDTGQTSAGFKVGEALPNFTYDIENLSIARASGVEISGAAPCSSGSSCPDMGAHDSASPQPMKFGLAAAPVAPTVTTTPPSTPASPVTAYVVGPGWGTGNVTANANGGQSPFTYSWVALDLGYVTYSTAQTPTATLNVWTQSCDSNTGHFRVTVTDAAGSTAFADVYFRAWSTRPQYGKQCY